MSEKNKKLSSLEKMHQNVKTNFNRVLNMSPGNNLTISVRTIQFS